MTLKERIAILETKVDNLTTYVNNHVKSVWNVVKWILAPILVGVILNIILKFI